MEKRELSVYSFDIFDTCITRISGKPDNIFYLLAMEVLCEKEESLIRAFVIERKAAEKRAMKSLNKEAVTLDNIYAFFNLSFFTEKTVEQVKKREMELEVQSYVPIRDTIKKIETLREKGRIIFISDMYLPYELIYDVLSNYGILKSGDVLYISGCVGLSKHSGKLFDYVGKKEHIKTNRWIHYGDNFHSDYLVPKTKGIKARKIDTNNSVYEAFLEKESRFTSFPLTTSVFSGLIRAARLNNCTDDGGFVSNIMVPLQIPFVVSLLKDAVSKKVKRLYFASRDMYGMYLIAKEFSAFYKDVEIHYLHISTKVVYPTLIHAASKEEILYILNYIGRFLPRKVLKLFSYADDEILRIGHFLDVDKELSVKDISINLFIEKMLEGDNAEKLKNRCAEKRKLFKEYLCQQGFCSDDNALVGLVDIGWRCTCQEMIRQIIDSPVVFYYWGVSPGRSDISKTGAFTAFSYWEDFKELYRSNKYIEFYICRNPEGSTLEYKQESGYIAPVFSNEVEDDCIIEEVRINNEILLKTSRWYKQYPYLLEYSDYIFKNLSLSIIIQFTQCPNKKMVRFLSKKLFWETSFGNSIPVIIKLYPWTAVYLAILYSLKSFNKKIYAYRNVWLDASLIYTYGSLGKQFVLCKQKVMSSMRLKNSIKGILYKLKR